VFILRVPFALPLSLQYIRIILIKYISVDRTLGMACGALCSQRFRFISQDMVLHISEPEVIPAVMHIGKTLRVFDHSGDGVMIALVKSFSHCGDRIARTKELLNEYSTFLPGAVFFPVFVPLRININVLEVGKENRAIQFFGCRAGSCKNPGTISFWPEQI